MTIQIKKGASFRVGFQFETDEEWGTLFPAEYASAQIKFGDVRYDLEVTVDVLSRSVFIKGETDNWPIGKGEFDIKVIDGDLIQTIPEWENIQVEVREGVTR